MIQFQSLIIGLIRHHGLGSQKYGTRAREFFGHFSFDFSLVFYNLGRFNKTIITLALALLDVS